MKIKYRKQTLFCMLITLLMIAGCGINSPTQVIQSTQTSPQATPSATKIRPTRTFRPTITYVPTRPTPDKTKQSSTLLNYLATNNGCELPCFWGITPGVSSWEDVMTVIFTPIVDNPYIKFEGDVRGFNIEGYGYVYFYLEDRIVESMVSGVYDLQTYQMDRVLEKYGTPDEIWLVAIPQSQTDEHGYILTLNYKKIGFLITYAGEGTFDSKSNTIAICPIEQSLKKRPHSGSELLIFWSPKNNPDYKGLIPTNIMSDLQHLRVEDFLGITPDEFTKLAQNQGDAFCFNVIPDQFYIPMPTPSR